MTLLDTALKYIQKAERALEDARVLLREASTEGACNRAYYAMFDAAHAALFAAGYRPAQGVFKTHHGLIAEFGLQLVQTGKIDPAFGRSLNRVQEIRLVADYSADPPPPDDATSAVEKAQQFVAAMRASFPSSPGQTDDAMS